MQIKGRPPHTYLSVAGRGYKKQMATSIAHKLERKAFEVAIDAAVKYTGKQRSKALLQLVDLTEKVLGDVWPPQAYDKLREAFRDENSKWSRYMFRLLEHDPKLIKTALLNLGYEAGFRGYRTAMENAKKYDCNIPWIMLIDPTSACNLHCVGCWAAEYGNKLNLSFEDLDSIITQGKELGIHAYLLTGGEPLVRKDDVIRLCRKHSDCEFQAFTNGTLIDDEFCRQILEVGNFIPLISLEGFEEANDARRGVGTFQRVMKAMDLLKAHKLFFGVSICYTSKNYMTVTSDEFLDMIIDRGALYTWYFHYMPVGNAASAELLPTPEQREYLYHRIREIRGFTGGKPIFAIDFQNDAEFVTGCVAGGRCYCHINAAGDMEPCAFVHYSCANIHDHTLLECLQQPLFKAYRKCQPFNKNMLQPCPMLENPEKLLSMVRETGAKSTDMESPEDCEKLCEKCGKYAEEWKPMADRLWQQSHEQQQKMPDKHK